MNEHLSLIVPSRHRHSMKSRQAQSWLRPGEWLARLFLAPDHDRAASLQSIFRFDSAEIWRLGQQRRSRYLAALLQMHVMASVAERNTQLDDRPSTKN
jgi:hypothetical protein